MKTYEYGPEAKSETFASSVEKSRSELSRAATAEPGGKVTAFIEAQTGKMPWVSFLGLSVISMAASAAIVATRKSEKDYASFVGLWAPCFMLLGVYNKLLQIERRLDDRARFMPEPHADVPTSTAYLS